MEFFRKIYLTVDLAKVILKCPGKRLRPVNAALSAPASIILGEPLQECVSGGMRGKVAAGVINAVNVGELGQGASVFGC